MNIKSNICRMISMGMMISAIVSCAGDEELSGSLDASKDKISTPTRLAFVGNATTTSFNIQANGLWNITTDGDWFNLDKTQGIGDAKITLTTTDSENPSALNSRTATLTVHTDNKTREISVVQTPANEILRIAQDSVTFARTSETLTQEILLENNSAWEILEHPDWYSVTPMSGQGTTKLTISVNKNNTDFNFSDAMTVKSEKMQEQVVIFQEGIWSSLSVSPTEIPASVIEGLYVIQLDGNATWTASTDAGWISLSDLQGEGTKALQITCSTNESASVRKGTVTIVTSRNTFVCNITQAVADVPYLETPTKDKVEKYGFTVTSNYTSEIPVSEYGFVYSLASKPTIADTKLTCTDGSRPFTLSASNLPSGREFYVRAFARNGAGIAYSEEIVITTGGLKPGADDNPTPNL